MKFVNEWLKSLMINQFEWNLDSTLLKLAKVKIPKMNVQWKNFDYKDAATKYNFDVASKYFKFNQNRPTASNIKPNSVPGIVRITKIFSLSFVNSWRKILICSF